MFSSNRSGAATVTSEHNSIWIWFPLSQTWFSWRHTSAALYLFMMVSRWLKLIFWQTPRERELLLFAGGSCCYYCPGIKGHNASSCPSLQLHCPRHCQGLGMIKTYQSSAPLHPGDCQEAQGPLEWDAGVQGAAPVTLPLTPEGDHQMSPDHYNDRGRAGGGH